MHTTLRRMTLPELLQRHGIYTIRDFSRRTGLSSQQAWNLWHGVVGLGRRNIQRLHEKLEIPAEELLQVPPPPPRPRKSTKGIPKPKGSAPEEPRPDRFGWEDGEVGYHPVSEEPSDA